MQIKNLLQAVPRVLFSNAPLDAQLIVTRRCNLSCGYCSEYDSFSQPVPLEDLKERIDALHRLGSVNITLLGGEPLMHPDVAEITRYAGRKANVSVVTNGFLLRNGVITALNDAGLNNLTVSIDTLHADLPVPQSTCRPPHLQVYLCNTLLFNDVRIMQLVRF